MFAIRSLNAGAIRAASSRGNQRTQQTGGAAFLLQMRRGQIGEMFRFAAESLARRGPTTTTPGNFAADSLQMQQTGIVLNPWLCRPSRAGLLSPHGPATAHGGDPLQIPAKNRWKQVCRDYAPVASLTHFLVKLVLAAPCSFFSCAAVSQEVCASFSHLVMKLCSAAPASFFSAACSLQLGPAASALAA